MRLKARALAVAIVSLVVLGSSGCGVFVAALSHHDKATTKAAVKQDIPAPTPTEPTRDPLVSGPFGPILLPKYRIVAYYGSPVTPAMGILGDQPTSTMLAQLVAQAKQYGALDPTHPVIEALEMVAVVAMGSPQSDHTYRLRMPYSMIQKELDLARAHHMLLILDVQVGHSTIPAEVRYLAPFLAQPDVELALDPEFDMKPGNIPGREFGTMATSDINWTLAYLNRLVIQDNLPQKILIVHQFIESMVPDWSQIRPVTHVAFVRDQDGFGGQKIKSANYERFIRSEAVPCTAGAYAPAANASHPSGAFWSELRIERSLVCGGFKLFYKQDKGLMTPAQVLSLDPPPLVVIYQ